MRCECFGLCFLCIAILHCNSIRYDKPEIGNTMMNRINNNNSFCKSKTVVLFKFPRNPSVLIF
jgi:hypothetical protein